LNLVGLFIYYRLHEGLSSPSFLTFYSAVLAIQQWHSTFQFTWKSCGQI